MQLVLIFLVYIVQVLAFPLKLKSPSDDDFYSLPKGFEDAKPGDILKVRKAPSRLASLFVPIDVKNVWQLVVRSEDSFGQPTAFITTIIEPHDADPSKVVSYQTWEDSAHINCSPSYGMQHGAPVDTIATQVDMTCIVVALKNGYFVTSPDYEGLNSAFTVGWRSGKAVLDSVRAVLKSGKFTGIKKDAKVGLWGYSGGSLASGWAAALQNSYAPELQSNLIGASLGGFVTNISAVAEIVDGSLLAGLIPLALTGLGNEYPKFRKMLNENLNPEKAQFLDKSKDMCIIPAAIYHAFDNILAGEDSMFNNGESLLRESYLREIADLNSLLYLNSSYVPKIPIFIYHGMLDKVVPIKDADKIYSKWCDWGIQSMEFSESLFTGHILEQVTGAPAGWTWLDRRLQGITPVKGCSRTARLSNIFYPNIEGATKSLFEGMMETFANLNLEIFSAFNPLELLGY